MPEQVALWAEDLKVGHWYRWFSLQNNADDINTFICAINKYYATTKIKPHRVVRDSVGNTFIDEQFIAYCLRCDSHISVNQNDYDHQTYVSKRFSCSELPRCPFTRYRFVTEMLVFYEPGYTQEYEEDKSLHRPLKDVLAGKRIRRSDDFYKEDPLDRKNAHSRRFDCAFLPIEDEYLLTILALGQPYRTRIAEVAEKVKEDKEQEYYTVRE